MCSVFEYYSNNILFVFVFGHNSEPEYYSYSYSAKYLCTNIIRIRIRSFWKNEYYSYSYSVKILIPNNIRIRIRSKKQYSLTSDSIALVSNIKMSVWSSDIIIVIFWTLAKVCNPALEHFVEIQVLSLEWAIIMWTSKEFCAVFSTNEYFTLFPTEVPVRRRGSRRSRKQTKVRCRKVFHTARIVKAFQCHCQKL